MKYLCLLVVSLLLLSCGNTPTVQQEVATATQLPYYNSADFTPIWLAPNAPETQQLHTISKFSFVNQNGDTITQKNFDGKIYVADFFFTICPGICKKLTNNLKIVQEAFKADSSVLLLSHSVTPENDSVPKLKAYAQRFNVISNKWHLVTGSRAGIYNIARKSYFADEDMGETKDSTDFLHTENILLIDKHKHIRGVYKGTSETEMQNLIADILLLKKES